MTYFFIINSADFLSIASVSGSSKIFLYFCKSYCFASSAGVYDLFIPPLPNIASTAGSFILIPLVSLKIKVSSGKFNGTPPLWCLGPLMICCSGIPSPLMSPYTVSPPSASKLASSLGTAVMYLLAISLGFPI